MDLPSILRQRRFGVPGIHVRRRALGENVDDMFGLGGELRRARGQGGDRVSPGGRTEQFLAEKAARLNAPNPMPARWRNWRRVTNRSSTVAECSRIYLLSVLITVSIP